MTKPQLFQIAERTFSWHQHEPHMNWEETMYYYLFKWAGWKE